jgi:Plasmid pRiA4b ORF-3-like protein
MDQNPRPEVYRLHVWIRQISPMIWRRFLIRSDSTLTDLHNTLQIAFGWSDFHLHRFRIRGQDYSVGQTIFTDLDINGDEVKLADFRFRINERFLYEYDFDDWWQHEVRIERRLPLEKKRIYPVCIGGKRAGPPEDCGGPFAFMERLDESPWEAYELLQRLSEDVKNRDTGSIQSHMESIRSLLEWLTLDRFDRKKVNRRLQQYAQGDEEWKWE